MSLQTWLWCFARDGLLGEQALPAPVQQEEGGMPLPAAPTFPLCIMREELERGDCSGRAVRVKPLS